MKNISIHVHVRMYYVLLYFPQKGKKPFISILYEIIVLMKHNACQTVSHERDNNVYSLIEDHVTQLNCVLNNN